MVSITPRLALLLFLALQVPFLLRIGRTYCEYSGSSNGSSSGSTSALLPHQQQATAVAEAFPPPQLQLRSGAGGGTSSSSSAATQTEERASSLSSPPVSPSTVKEDAFPQHLKELYQYRSPALKTTEQLEALAQECGSDAPHYSALFQQHSHRRSYMNEDKTVYELFFQDLSPDESKNLKYVEVGAFDGMDASNSRFYEACLQWEGLLVEPNPQPFEKLERNRPHAHVVSMAASCSASDAANNMTIAFNDYPYPNAGQADSVNPYSGRHETQVPCGPLTPIIQGTLGDRVHFLSLDVEGSEPRVLAHLDLDVVRVDVLLVEVINPYCPAKEDCASRKETRSIMKERGYHRFENLVKNSDVFVHPDSPFLAKLEGKAVAATE